MRSILPLTSCALLYSTCVAAIDTEEPVPLMRRGGYGDGYANMSTGLPISTSATLTTISTTQHSTASQTNSTTLSTPPSSLLNPFTSSTKSLSSTTIITSTTPESSSIHSNVSTSVPSIGMEPPSLEPSLNIPTSTPPSCIGSATYVDAIPPTVYVTTTESFGVTVTAADVSLSTPPIITPPPLCSSTLIPLSSVARTSATYCQRGHCMPLPQQATETSVAFQTLQPFTSTITVTKKTPVPVLVSDTSLPPNFQLPTPTTSSTIAENKNNGASTGGGSKAPTAGVDVNVNQPANQRPTATPASNAGNEAEPGSLSPAPTTANVGNVPVTIVPSNVIIGGQLVPLPGGQSQTTVVANGQTFTVNPSQVIAPGTTIIMDNAKAEVTGAAAHPVAITADGITLSIGASLAVFSGFTYSIGAGATATTIIANGQTISIGSNGVGLPSTTLSPADISPTAPSLSTITAGGMTLAVGTNRVVLSGTTYSMGAGAIATTISANGQTISIGSDGVGFKSTTLRPASVTAAPSFSIATAEGLTLSVDASQAVISGTTYRIGAGATATTAIINGQTISIGSDGVGLKSTTVHPASITAAPSLSAVTAGGFTFSVDGSEAVISGTTYQIGSGASATTVILNGQTISIGSNGVGLKTTTVRPATITPAPSPSLLSAVTAGGLTFSIDGTEAVISGTMYQIGRGASATTTVIGGQTVSLGPGGVGLATTTVAPLSSTAPVAATSGVKVKGGAASSARAAVGSLFSSVVTAIVGFLMIVM